ncbi:MAG: glutathione S-transferase [Dokdonella sp.]
MALPIFYSFRRCPYAMRARMALVVSEQQVELREVRLRDKPVELLAASPKGTVPVLIETDGKVLDESLDIMVWALRRNDPEDWLDASTDNADDMFDLISRCDVEFKQALDSYKYPQRFIDVDPLRERERAAPFLASLEDRLERSSYLFGHQASIADISIMPFVRQFRMVDPEWFDTSRWPRLRDWLDGWIASKFFERIMIRLEAWSPDRPGVIFPVAGSLD